MTRRRALDIRGRPPLAATGPLCVPAWKRRAAVRRPTPGGSGVRAGLAKFAVPVPGPVCRVAVPSPIRFAKS